MDGFIWVLIIIGIIVIILAVSNIKIVPSESIYIVERLGNFHSIWTTGKHFKCPFIDCIIKKVSLKEQVVNLELQPFITCDNILIKSNAAIYFQIKDPKLYTYSVENPITAIKELYTATFRNIIGELNFNDILTSYDNINERIKTILNSATKALGIEVKNVELKNIFDEKR